MGKKITFFIPLILFCFVLIYLPGVKRVQAAEDNKTRVMITSYHISEDTVSPAETFDLTLTIKNTSPVYPVYSVLVSSAGTSETVYPVYGASNQVYVESLNPNEEKVITMKMTAASNIDVNSLDLIMNLSYYDSINGTGDNQSVIQIPIKLESSLVIQNYTIPEKATLGTKTRIGTTYENVGSKELYDVVIHITGNGMKEQTEKIGTVAAGTLKNQEIYFSFSNVGEQEVTVYIVYKDSEGVEYRTDNIVSKVMVSNDQSDSNNTIIQNSATNIQFKTWQKILVAAIIIVGVVIIILVRREKRK